MHARLGPQSVFRACVVAFLVPSHGDRAESFLPSLSTPTTPGVRARHAAAFLRAQRLRLGRGVPARLPGRDATFASTVTRRRAFPFYRCTREEGKEDADEEENEEEAEENEEKEKEKLEKPLEEARKADALA